MEEKEAKITILIEKWFQKCQKIDSAAFFEAWMFNDRYSGCPKWLQAPQILNFPSAHSFKKRVCGARVKIVQRLTYSPKIWRRNSFRGLRGSGKGDRWDKCGGQRGKMTVSKLQKDFLMFVLYHEIKYMDVRVLQHLKFNLIFIWFLPYSTHHLVRQHNKFQKKKF